jgi:hypothetical protein
MIEGGDKPRVEILTSPAMTPMTGLGDPSLSLTAREHGTLDCSHFGERQSQLRIIGGEFNYEIG